MPSSDSWEIVTLQWTINAYSFSHCLKNLSDSLAKSIWTIQIHSLILTHHAEASLQCPCIMQRSFNLWRFPQDKGKFLCPGVSPWQAIRSTDTWTNNNSGSNLCGSGFGGLELGRRLGFSQLHCFQTCPLTCLNSSSSPPPLTPCPFHLPPIWAWVCIYCCA